MTSERTISGELEVKAQPVEVLKTIGDIANIEQLAPGIRRVVWVDPQKNSAMVLVNMKIGGINFEREVEVNIKSVDGGAQINTSTYGLEFQALVKVSGSPHGSRIMYEVIGKPTSFAGRLVLDALGERVVAEFAREFEVRLNSLLSRA
ncbi:MAG: hypothetical protein QW453_01380 [Thermoprotei archaeon]